MTEVAEAPMQVGSETGGWVDVVPAWVLGSLVALVCLLAYLPTAAWDYLQITDQRATVTAAWSLADHGSIEVDTDWPDVPWALEGPDGNLYVWRHPGGIAWTALFYLPTNTSLSPTSVREVPFGPATASAVLATALGVGVMTSLFRRLATARIAVFAGLLLGLGTSNWTVSADSAWNHGPTLLFLALGLLAASRDRHAWSGLAFAAAITVRPHVAVAPAAMGIAAGWRERRVLPVIALAVTSLLGLAVVVWFYARFFGTPTIRPDQTASFFSGDVNLTDEGWAMNTLRWFFDPWRGLFLFSPFLLALLPALRDGWRAAPSWVRASAVSAVLYAVIQTRADVFHAGLHFFGYRGPLEMLTLAAPLLLVSYEQYGRGRDRWRTTVVVLSLASVVVYALGATVLDPKNRSHVPCNVDRYVADYRPEPERLAAARDIWTTCYNMDPSELPSELQDLAPAGGG